MMCILLCKAQRNISIAVVISSSAFACAIVKSGIDVLIVILLHIHDLVRTPTFLYITVFIGRN